jgi:hypothetical protein
MDATDSPFYTGRNGAKWFLSILGGIKREGRWQMPQDMRVIAGVGGVNFDLTEAELPANPVLTKFSLVGGVSLRVPENVAVEVEGLRLFGGARIAASSVPATVTIKVREYSIIGGVHVQRG